MLDRINNNMMKRTEIRTVAGGVAILAGALSV